ncbi:MAG: hypothetical protein IKL10_04735 [Clostridia bacterium]|nr:hypothetical protein [Clostridia bacterium]
MSYIRIEEVGSSTVQKAEKMLAGIPGGIEKALKDAMSRAVSNIRTGSSDKIRERYAISKANIRANENVSIKYSYSDGVRAFVTFSGNKIPLYRYDGASPQTPTWDMTKKQPVKTADGWRMLSPGAAAFGHLLQDTAPVKFDNAFVAQMKSGHIGIFERTGGAASDGGDEIREIMGLSVPQMLGHKEVEEKLTDEAMEVFTKRLDDNILRILNGW